MGYRGLALGTSITALLNASVQLWLLRREIDGIEGSRHRRRPRSRAVAAAVIMGAVTWGTHIGVAPRRAGRAFVLQASACSSPSVLSLADAGGGGTGLAHPGVRRSPRPDRRPLQRMAG